MLRHIKCIRVDGTVGPLCDHDGPAEYANIRDDVNCVECRIRTIYP